MDGYNEDFWNALDELVSNSEIVIDRPRGSAHPRFPNFIYKVDYRFNFITRKWMVPMQVDFLRIYKMKSRNCYNKSGFARMKSMKTYRNISTIQAEALILLQSLIYGFGDPISKIAFEVTPVYAMMTARYLIAFAFSLAIYHRRIIRTVRTVPVKSWLIPGVCISMYYVLNNVALALTDATSVAFLRSLSIVITPAFAYLIYHTGYRWQHITLQMLVLPGMYLLCAKGGLSGFGAGEVISVIAAFMSAGALVFSKRYLDEVDPASMTCLMAGCSAVIALAGSMMFESGIHLETTTPRAWGIILYLALMCTFLGYLLQNLALMKISDRSVALIQSLCPVMTAAFSFLLLGEALSPAGIAGAGIIVVCVALASIIKS